MQTITKDLIKQFIVVLADTYGKELTKTRLHAYEALLSGVLIGKDYTECLHKIATAYDYFPTPKQVLDLYTVKLPTPRENAETLVDRFIGYLEGRLSYEQVGSEQISYCTKRFSCDKYAFQSGNINLDFKRREWVDKATQDYERPDSGPYQITSPRVLSLISDINEGKNGKENPKADKQ